MAIRIGIMGYGNIGKGIETALADYPDMELAVVFTRRNPADVKIHTSEYRSFQLREAEKWKDKVDVLVLAGGSATDLPEQTSAYASLFNVIDTFDTHAHISEHFAKVDEAAKNHGKTAMISVGRIPAFSPWPVFSAMSFCLTAKTTPSGAAVFPRATPMPSAEFPV